MRRLLSILVGFTLLFWSGPIAAQDVAGETAPAGEPETAGELVTTDAPWTVDTERLRLELRPLRVDALAERAEYWMAVYTDTVGEVSRARLADDEAEIQDLVARKAAVVSRFDMVLDALESKGGDAAEYRDFLAATDQLEVNLLDPEEAINVVVGWLTSPEGGIAVGIGIVQFAVIVMITFVIAGIVGGAAKSAVKRLPKASSLLQEFVVKISRGIVMIVGVVIAISFLGVNIGPLVAAIGAAGLVIGLALQGTLSNFASGVLILVYRPYDVGDVINGGGVLGKVEAMNLVSTRIATFDNQVMFVPNNEIWNGVITNITARDTRRVDLTFGIGYADDMARAEGIIREVLGSHEKILKDPEAVIKVHELADSSVNFVVRPWSKTADYWDVYWDVTRRVKERFDAEGVGIPFPQRDLSFSGPVEVVMKNG